MRQDGTDQFIDRGAPADLWWRTLSQIPSVYGRLVYLSSLRGPSGVYEHYGFSERFGALAAQSAMLHSHEQEFERWLCLSLEEKKNDIDRYLEDFISDRPQMIETWIRWAPYRNLVPATVRESERRYFQLDVDLLLEILRREHNVERPDPEA